MPIEDTVGAMAELVAEGLVRHIGLSNVNAEQLERAVTVHEISAVQCEWSLWSPVDHDLLTVANRYGVGIVAWSPLGGGLLTGNVTSLDSTDFRNNFPRYEGANLALNNDRFAPLKALATEFEISSSQMALAWLLHQHPAVVPIPGSRNAAHIRDNAAAAQISLTAEALDCIERQLASFHPEGSTITETTTARQARPS